MTEASSKDEAKARELQALRSKVAAMRPLMRNISAFGFSGKCLGVLVNCRYAENRNDDVTSTNTRPTNAFRVHVQPCLVPSTTNDGVVSIASQEIVSVQKYPMKIPRVQHDSWASLLRAVETREISPPHIQYLISSLEVFRSGQTLFAYSVGIRRGHNDLMEGEDFHFMDRFSLTSGGRQTHQDRFYLQHQQDRTRYSWIQLVGDDDDDDINENEDQQRLLVVTTSDFDYSSQVRLIPAAALRDRQRAGEAANAAPRYTLTEGATNFVVSDLDNGQQELLMSVCRQGLLSLSLQDFADGAVVEPRVLFQPENEDESVRDVQLLDNVPWVLVWNRTSRSSRLVKLGQGGNVLKSVPISGGEMRFL